MAQASTSEGGRPSETLSAERKLEMFRWIVLTRRLEERLTNLYRQNRVVGGLYRSLGQEGETVAAACALEPGDPIGPLIRNLGALLVRGYRPRDIAMQYMARAGGPTGGKDLNVHFGDPARGVIPPVSMLGDLVPVMAGTALAATLRGEDRVALTYIGDGGSSTGAFAEGLHLAAVWKLPLLVVAEANHYAYSTPTARQMAVDSMVRKAEGLGVDGVRVDGNDVLAVYDAVRTARERAAADAGPALIEVLTYRRKGHAEHDMQKYVPAGEIETWEKNDPLDRYRATLLADGTGDEEVLAAIETEVAETLEIEIAAAEASPFPDPDVALQDVYAEPPRATDTLAPYRDGAR